MIKKSVTYTDYEGNEKTEDFRFHMSKAELMELELETEGGMQNFINKIVEKEDVKGLANLIKKLVLKSYGELSDDGNKFLKIKNGHRLSEDFEQTEAFSELYLELNSDEQALTDFISGIIPAGLRQEIASRG